MRVHTGRNGSKRVLRVTDNPTPEIYTAAPTDDLHCEHYIPGDPRMEQSHLAGFYYRVTAELHPYLPGCTRDDPHRNPLAFLFDSGKVICRI